MAIDYAAIAAAGGFGKGTPRAASRLKKQRDESSEIKRCYAKVDERDGRRCQFPGCRKSMQEHHHLEPRSTASKAVKHTPANVTSLCTEHHSWFKAGLVKATGNANRGLKWSLTKLGRAAKIRIPKTEKAA